MKAKFGLETKPGIRSIFDLFKVHKPIPAVPLTTLIPRLAAAGSKKQEAEAKRLRKQMRNIKNVQLRNIHFD